MLVLKELTQQILGAAIEVHRVLGPGLLESTYEICLCEELRLRGLRWERQVSLPVSYKGITIQEGYRIDILIEGQVAVEVKAIDAITSIHKQQLLTYLKHKDLRVGLLINFNVPVLTDGLHRIVN